MTPTPSSDFAIEHGHADYTDAELLEQVRGNAQALILASVAFLEQRGIPPAEWAAAVGATFASGWGDVRPWDAGEFLDAMLTNLRALGAEVAEVELGVHLATATIVGYPDPELCAVLGVEPARAAVIHDAAAVIAAPRGLSWDWRIEPDGATRFEVVRVNEE